jgi:hypothetical protein
MVEINPETQKTRRERLATVIAIGASVFIHIFVFIGGIQIYQWAEEEEKREKLMVVRLFQTLSDISGDPRPAPSRKLPPPDARVIEKGPETIGEETVISDKESGGIEDVLGEIPPPEEEEEEEAAGETVMSVVTDLSAATFTVSGPTEYHGFGTFWTRKGVPTGDYTATFHPVPGHKTPPISTKTLEAESRIVFVGKYTRSVEVEVIINDVPGASFEIRRPDGIPLGMTQPGRAFFEDLPLGAYTIVFHDVPGYLTPPPQTKTLEKGGRLAVVGIYRPGQGGKAEERPVEPGARSLDRRVQMVVKSYPPTAIEENFDYITYPALIFTKSNFQQGWCRVYLVVDVDDGGNITGVHVERPKREERERFSELIDAVETAIGGWSFDRVRAEVHVDVRFYVE